MINLTKFFPWLSIRTKLTIAFVGLCTIPVSLVGIYGLVSNVRTTERTAFADLTHDVGSIREKTVAFLTNVDTDLQTLQNSPLFRQYIRAVEEPSFDADQHQLLARLTPELLAFVTTKGIYYKLRIVRDGGDELFRVEEVPNGRAERAFRIVPQSELRTAREAYYFLLVQHLQAGQIIFAPAELVRATNERVPVISFAMPIMTRHGRAGILIADVFASDLFRFFSPSREFGREGSVVLVDSAGHYLFHSQKKSAWNQLLASREEDNVLHDYPSPIAAQLLSGQDGILDAMDIILWHGPLFSAVDLAGSQEPVFRIAQPLYIFESVPKGVILRPVYSLAWTFAAFLAIFLVVATGLGLLATQHFTTAIAEVQRGANIISGGNYRHRLRIETRDEIEVLAEQFNEMAASLEQHEAEIMQHRAKLEQMVEQRTEELAEEKSKLQAILDNVPNAFVLLDRDLRIQTASAAFSRFSGTNGEGVRGRDWRALYCRGGSCEECVCEAALATGASRGHIDHLVGPGGADRYIEHIAIPLREDGEISSVLEIITDVSERKRLEQNLIRTEKLAAAGEMSAFIAHEFRNALTSIKMILQLQRESDRLNRADRKSLDVALNSLSHMEGIVSELLNFSRSSPVELRDENLRTIIDDSIAFVQVQMESNNIELRKAIENSLPSVPLDSSRWKEALSNLLLNAIQAIESKESRDAHEMIFVGAHQLVLQGPVSDFGVVGLESGEQEKPLRFADSEVVLGSGTSCISVEITDTGAGIDYPNLRRMFDPFFTTKANGTGLGLPLVKRTVSAHGGVISVRSVKGKGTTFTILLPVRRNGEGSGADPAGERGRTRKESNR
jgi:PAS domain S-box-containing protein